MRTLIIYLLLIKYDGKLSTYINWEMHSTRELLSILFTGKN